MKWSRQSPHVLTGDLGYKICRNKVGQDVYYRPSFSGSFISAPQTDLDESKAICEAHAKENQQ